MSSEPEKLLLKASRFNVHAMQLIGSDGVSYQREVVRHPGAVVLLPILNRDSIVMIKNTRPSVDETLLELPAGTREPGEPVMETAHRELIEETGYSAGRLDLLHEFYSAPGICDEMMSLFVARELTAGQHAREATEQIENVIATRADLVEWIRDGKIRDAKSLVGAYAFLFSPELNSA